MKEPAGASNWEGQGARGRCSSCWRIKMMRSLFRNSSQWSASKAGRASRVPHERRGRASGAGPACRRVRARPGRVGVPRSEIRFLGTDLSIPDGELFRHLSSAYRALLEDCRSIGDLGALLTLAWEGGHPDHDAAHVLAINWPGNAVQTTGHGKFRSIALQTMAAVLLDVRATGLQWAGAGTPGGARECAAPRQDDPFLPVSMARFRWTWTRDFLARARRNSVEGPESAGPSNTRAPDRRSAAVREALPHQLRRDGGACEQLSRGKRSRHVDSVVTAVSAVR